METVLETESPIAFPMRFSFSSQVLLMFFKCFHSPQPVTDQLYTSLSIMCNTIHMIDKL